MCKRNKCHGCGGTSFYYCEKGDWSQVETHCHQAMYVPPNRRKKCATCITIEGTIIKLRNMVIQQPWLETEGVSGAENRPAWETEGRGNDEEHQQLCKEFWARAGLELNARLKAMNLDNLNGRENLMDGDGIATTAENKEDTASEQAGSSWGSGEGTMTSEGSVRVVNSGECDLDNETTVTVDYDDST